MFVVDRTKYIFIRFNIIKFITNNYTSTPLLTSIGLPTSLAPSFPSFADRTHAECWARGFSERNGWEECYVVAISTAALGRGPIFRAADSIDVGVQSPMEASQHWSEYLVLYRIPVAALIDEVVVSAGK